MKKTLMLMLLSGLILSACGREETIDDIDQKAVDRWQALIAGDYQKAHGYIAPSHRELENLDSYQTRMATARLSIDWQAAKFVNKDCQEYSCEVTMVITYLYKFQKRSLGETKGKTAVKENWIKSDKKWYFLPDEKKKI
ncbi:MAG: hypothetical protein DWP95_03760 [Proteobacteria bacterium]|nr:MAG: hypothetical protein DWP95_03760 [Pseudomonadota bacterium]